MAERVRILLVDDERDFLTVTARIISSLGYDVKCAASGDEALGIYKDTSCDILITDLKMPVMDGFELIHKIRAINSTQRIIVSTAMHSQVVPWNKRFACSDVPGEGVEMSSINFLLKPFSKKTLAAAIEKTLLGEAFWSGSEVFANGAGRETARQTGGQDGPPPLDCLYFIDLYRVWKNNVSLEVEKGNLHGTIYIREGDVADARTESSSGLDALREILSWKNPVIRLSPCPERIDITIKGFFTLSSLTRDGNAQVIGGANEEARVTSRNEEDDSSGYYESQGHVKPSIGSYPPAHFVRRRVYVRRKFSGLLRID